MEIVLFGLISFLSFIICEMDKFFGNSCLVLDEFVFCVLFFGFLWFGCGGVIGLLMYCCLFEFDVYLFFNC